MSVREQLPTYYCYYTAARHHEYAEKITILIATSKISESVAQFAKCCTISCHPHVPLHTHAHTHAREFKKRVSVIELEQVNNNLGTYVCAWLPLLLSKSLSSMSVRARTLLSRFRQSVSPTDRQPIFHWGKDTSPFPSRRRRRNNCC